MNSLTGLQRGFGSVNTSSFIVSSQQPPKTHTVAGGGGNLWFIVQHGRLQRFLQQNRREQNKCLWMYRVRMMYMTRRQTNRKQHSLNIHRESQRRRATMHAVVRDKSCFILFSLFCKPALFAELPTSTSGGQMFISTLSLIFSPSFLCVPLGRPGVNLSLLHLAETTHAQGSTQRPTSRECMCSRVCAAQLWANKGRPVLTFTQKQLWHEDF